MKRKTQLATTAVFLIISATAYALPDILPKKITLTPSSVAANGMVTVSFTVTNQGDTSAGATTTRLRINSSSTTETTSDPVLADISTPAIAAGASTSLSTNVNVGSTTGTRYVWVILDNFSAITQSNYVNDIAHSPSLTVTNAALPAPSITSVSPTSMPALNGNQTLTINGTNFQNIPTLTFVPPEGGTIPSTASKL